MPGYVKISLIYLLAALIWVVGSNVLFIAFAPDVFASFFPFKGVVFVLLTTPLLYVLLRRSERRRDRTEGELRAILDGMSDVYYRADLQGRLLSISPQVETVLGYSCAELQGRELSSLYVDPVRRLQLLAQMERNGGRVMDFEAQLRRKDSSLVWVSISSRYLRAAGGDVTGIEGMVRMIDERKQAEVLQQETANLIEGLLNTSPDATMLLDLHGCLLAANEVMAQRFGLDLKALDHVSVYDLFPPEVADSRRHSVEEVIATGLPIQSRDIRNGRYYDNSIYPVRGLDGRVEKVAVFSRDVTVQHKTEMELQEREEIYRAMFENTAIVKLRTDPDTGAIMDANKAAAEFYGWSRERLRQMRVSDLNLWGPDRTSHEMSLVRQGQTTNFQARHRLASGQIRDVEVHSSPIRVRGRTFLHSIIIDVTERLHAERALNDARLQAEASARAELAFIARMSQELRTPLNGILGTTRLLTESPLAPEQREWLDNIGQCNADLMAILDELMMFSEGRSGGETPAPVSSPSVAVGAQEDLSGGLPSLRILLAEDNYINQKVTEAILSRRGHVVTTVGDGVEAVKAMEKAHFDLILMDVQMPGRDGLWAARTLREQGHDTPIMALTAQAMPKDAELCLQAGMNGYISKPFTAERLMNEIALLLQSLKR
ncbi:MAG TPA: PAS domain S-box protein [Candidatus Sulfotelmatobacter sp.]|jgi:PAS domain S-box-containing protein|nr:PAS domain S-box protein [Candidatus Sulfotelmatobacter sp.]